jgi:hypothetical protein
MVYTWLVLVPTLALVAALASAAVVRLEPAEAVALLVHDWALVRAGWTPVLSATELAPVARTQREIKDRYDAWFHVRDCQCARACCPPR